MQNDKKVVLRDFSLKPNEPIMLDFLNDYDFTNLIKSNTCFKGDGSCIDLTFTNRKYSFKFSTTCETGLYDHYTSYTKHLRHRFRKRKQKRSFTMILKKLLIQIFNLGQ